MGLRSPGYEIEAPSICYPTLPMLILRQVPVGMHTPIPTQWSKLLEKAWKVETRKSFDKRTRMYSCVAHHHHEDHNIRTWMRTQCKENTQLKATREGWILHKSQSQQNYTSWNHSTDLNLGVWILHESQWCNKRKIHGLTPLASIQECGFYMNPSIHETKSKVQ